MGSEVTKRNTAQILPSGELTVWGLKRQKGKQLQTASKVTTENTQDHSGTHRKDVTLLEGSKMSS